MDLTDVRQDAERRAAGLPAQLVERIAERIGGVASSSAVFGTPVEREGITVIPVAKLQWGFGAGGGSGATNGQELGSGGGGGGGVNASPIGYIAVSNGQAQFHPIHEPMRGITNAPIILASGIAAWIALSGLRRLLRG